MGVKESESEGDRQWVRVGGPGWEWARAPSVSNILFVHADTVPGQRGVRAGDTALGETRVGSASERNRQEARVDKMSATHFYTALLLWVLVPFPHLRVALVSALCTGRCWGADTVQEGG